MTRRYAILGDPVAHSLSPTIQNAAFAHAKLDATYERRRVDEHGLARAIEDIRSARLAGANVTMPHKQRAAGLADEVRGVARQIGAANTLWHEDGKVIAASTDPDGVLFAWSYAGLPDNCPVLILGAGGAAMAAVVALRDRPVRVSARREDAAREMVVRLGSDASVIPWGTSVPACVLINATPIGMHGEVLPAEVVAGAVGFLEMTYGSAPSAAQQEFARRSIPVATGEMMLVGQGAASFRVWTGTNIPHSVMLDSIPTG